MQAITQREERERKVDMRDRVKQMVTSLIKDKYEGCHYSNDFLSKEKVTIL